MADFIPPPCTIHWSMSTALLKWAESDFGLVARLFKRTTGLNITTDELRAQLQAAYDRGHDTLAIGCDHIDEKGRCLGHPIEEEA